MITVPPKISTTGLQGLIMASSSALPTKAPQALVVLAESSLASDYVGPLQAFVAAFSVIFVSELGDKTFIITAIMAMKNSRLLVFGASATALLLMTMISVAMGIAVTVVPDMYTHYASIVLFLCFGLKMLKEAYDMSVADDGAKESEFDEVERSLASEEVARKVAATGSTEIATTNQEPPTPEATGLTTATTITTTIRAESQHKTSGLWNKAKTTLQVAPLVIKVFTMVFVAEWGDRSQISTVILAAREDVVGVLIGSLSGHIFCTALAVIGGRFVADMISVKTMTFVGGLIFLFFAIVEIVTGLRPQI